MKAVVWVEKVKQSFKAFQDELADFLLNLFLSMDDYGTV